MTRAAESANPPAEKPTTILMVWLGYPCADASPMKGTIAMASTIKLERATSLTNANMTPLLSFILIVDEAFGMLGPNSSLLRNLLEPCRG